MCITCIKIGQRHAVKVINLVINNQPLFWHQELPYLGIILLGGKSFQINYQKIKQKYYCALNSIIGKVGLNTQPEVLI